SAWLEPSDEMFVREQVTEDSIEDASLEALEFMFASKSVTLELNPEASPVPVMFISARALDTSPLSKLVAPEPSDCIPLSEAVTFASRVEASAVPVLCMFMKSRPVKFAILEVSPVTLLIIELELVVAPTISSSNEAIPELLRESISDDARRFISEVSEVTPSFMAVASEVTPSFISDELSFAASPITPVDVSTLSDISDASADTVSFVSLDLS